MDSTWECPSSLSINEECDRLVDPPGHPAMATGIEVTIAKLFWALGYHTVEYYITELDPSRLEIAEKTAFTPPGGRPRAP